MYGRGFSPARSAQGTGGKAESIMDPARCKYHLRCRNDCVPAPRPYNSGMKKLVDLDALRAALTARKAEVAAEIRHYPGPIPGCDAQFNRLLEVRRILARELQRLDTVQDIGVEEFVGTSPSAEDLHEILPPR